MTSVPIDLDWEKMIVLLDRFRTRRPSRQEAAELEPLLKNIIKRPYSKVTPA